MARDKKRTTQAVKIRKPPKKNEAKRLDAFVAAKSVSNGKGEQTTIYLDPDLKHAARVFAADKRVSLSELCAQGLRAVLPDV